MDNCIVCCKSNDDVFSRITTVSSEWTEWNIKRIIEKHLWWWYLRPPSNKETEQWICRQCWHELSTFHNFYIKVEKENREYDKVLNKSIKINKEELTTLVDIKVEEENFEQFTILTENVMQLEKPKRGRKKRITNPTEIIQIELPAIEVKTENEDIPELTKTELDVSNMVTTDFENCFLNDNGDSEDNTVEENNLVDNDNDNKLNVFLNKKITCKRQGKSKSVTKYRKKYTKSKKEKKPNLIKDTNTSEIIKKNDEFIADNQFELYCNVCNTSVSNFNDLKNHFRKEHNILGYAMCCNKKFYKRGVLVDHLNIHKDPNYFKCLQCEKAYSARRTYLKHLKTHQQNETQETLFTCDKCEKSFLKKPAFERHLLTHVPEEEKNFHCDLCDKKFASEFLRKQHHTLSHLKKYSKICDICGKLLCNKFLFNQHMSEHNGEPLAKVKCEICGAELTNKYRLNRHIKMMHTEETQHDLICPYCSKVSHNLNAHKHHIKYTHILERKHACHMCDKKFRRPFELKEHLSTHTGEPLYTCPYCPRTFISNANMYKHRRLTHRKEWEEGRLKKEAKALAAKGFINSISSATQNESSYTDMLIMENVPENEAVPNVELNF